jgi:hypothetical protein
MITTDTKAQSQPSAGHAPLQLSDRCDSCGAQAFVAVQLDGTAAELLFCGHHYRRHETALAAAGARIHDERSRINEKPSVSANAD